MKKGQGGESKNARMVWLVNMGTPQTRFLSFYIKVIFQAISIYCYLQLILGPGKAHASGSL